MIDTRYCGGWFQWIGGHVCDGCGQAPQYHQGLSWHTGSLPFGPQSEVHIRWEDYGPGKRLNVPLFTLTFGTPTAFPGYENDDDDLLEPLEGQAGLP